MKKSKQLIGLTAIASFLFFSCQKDMRNTSAEELDAQKANSTKENTVGYVYTLSNAAAGNKVVTYSRSSSGLLTWLASYPTGGNGTGAGLGSQGAVTLRDNILLAVNAGSNSLTSFTLSGKGLEWKSTVASGGTTPISVTVHDNLVYVLNGGGTGNISGFTLDDDGMLHPLANSTRPLSSSASAPAQISFVQDGAAVVVTEKATNKIISYTINANGTPGTMHMLASANATPFGFAVGSDGMIYVSEAAGGMPAASTVSSYHVAADGTISLITGPVSAAQTAACWVVLTNNEKYVYATNTGSNNVSSFNAAGDGALTVLSAAAASMNIKTPIDAALSNNSKFLYVLNSGDHSITAMSVANDGSLGFLQNVSGLPVGDAGLAAK